MPRQIYRIGADIYNASNNQRIGSTDWAQNWSGKSDVQDLGQRTISQPTSTTTTSPDISKMFNANKVSSAPLATTKINQYDTDRKALQEKILANLQPTESETLLQKQLNNLLSRYESSVPALEGQGRGIALPLIRGQQAKLEQQAQAQMAPLQRQLGLEQTTRQGALTAAQEAYKLIPEKQKPMTISAGQSIIDPETGDVIYTAPDTESSKMITLSAGQSIYDPKTGKIVYSSPKAIDTPSSYDEWSLAGGETGTGQSYAEWVGNSKGLNSKITSQVDALAKGFDNNPITKRFSTILEGSQFVSSISNNTKNPADNQALIYAFAKAMDPDSVVREGEYATVQKYSQTWLESFGFNAARIINNQEFLTPQAIANIKATIETKFKAAQQNYNNLYNETTRKINLKTGQNDGSDYLTQYDFTGQQNKQQLRPLNKSYMNLDALLSEHPEYESLLQEMATENPDMTEEEALQNIQQISDSLGFNSGDSGTPIAVNKTNTKKVADAIGQFESGGNYKAIGKETGKGKAYGKYQIMDFNIPAWSRQALGYAITTQQFLNNPSLQDKIAHYKIEQLINTYGNVGDVASVWFSGRPLAKAGNAKDVIGTSVPQYVKNINSIYNKLG
mgnify:CR=1 FL=1